MPASNISKIPAPGTNSTYAEIVGWGKCLPPAILSNADLTTLLDTTDDWIYRRTGIRQRPISHVPVSDLGYVAAMRALASAGLAPRDVELVVLGSCTADEQMPNTASRIQRSIGAIQAAAVDINTACTSFMYALSYGSAMVRTGAVNNAVVIGSDTLSSYMDWEDRRPAVVFGDGAGAVVLKATAEPLGIVGERLGCVYASRDVLRIKGIGAAYANAGITFGTTEWDFDGREVFRQAVGAMSSGAKQVLSKVGYTNEEIDLVIPHQANYRIIEAVARRLGTPMAKVFTHLEKCGNLSSASIPVALVDAIEQGRVEPNCTLLVPAFGGGMTWSAHVIKWGRRTKSLGTNTIELRPCEKTGLELVHSLRARKNIGPSSELPEAVYAPTPIVTPPSKVSKEQACAVAAVS